MYNVYILFSIAIFNLIVFDYKTAAPFIAALFIIGALGRFEK